MIRRSKPQVNRLHRNELISVSFGLQADAQTILLWLWIISVQFRRRKKRNLLFVIVGEDSQKILEVQIISRRWVFRPRNGNFCRCIRFFFIDEYDCTQLSVWRRLLASNKWINSYAIGIYKLHLYLRVSLAKDAKSLSLQYSTPPELSIWFVTKQ